MKKVFLDNLPKWKEGSYKGKTNWEESINYNVKFIYDDIKGEFKIVKYYKKNNISYLDVKYSEKIYSIAISNLLNSKLGNIIDKMSHQHKYQVGDIITDITSGKLEILEQIKINNTTIKKYKYKCLICGNIDTINESNLNKNKGCNVCAGKKVLKGYNDMWTTNPNLAKLLADPNDGYKYTQSSNKKVNWRCPDCGNIIKNKLINNMNYQGLSCPKCSDKISYPEKFVFNILQQLNIEFIYQLSKFTLSWCKIYRYDFYFKINNKEYILETHGDQHYQEKFQFNNSIKKIKNLQEEQENDRLKKELALQNNIKEENYIVIDCRKSELEFIKNNIINSRLGSLFDLSKIDWLKCHEYACNSLIKVACDLWNSGFKSTKEIGKIMRLDRHTICKYLKKGKLIDWCEYNPKEEIKKTWIKNGKSVGKLIEIFKDEKSLGIFESGADLSRRSEKEFGIKLSNPSISNVCNNKQKHYKGFTFKYI